MPRLPDKTALGEAPLQGHRPSAMIEEPRGGFASGDGLVANEIAKGAVKIGGILEAKQHEADDYEVQKAIVDFDLEQEKRLDDAKRNAAPEAKGFTEGYRGGYDSAATDLMKRIPDRLKPKVDEALVKRGASFEKRAYDFELAERDRWNIQDVNTQSSDLITRTMTNPDSMEDNAQRGVAVIRASRLTARAKVDAERKFLDNNAEYGIKAIIDREVAEGRDPGSIVERLRKTPRVLLGDDRAYRADEALPPERIGSVSAKYESGGRGVGLVSSGKGDPGGVSYGAHQLSTKDSMPAFLRSEEAAPYAEKFAGLRPGSPEFNRAYKQVAEADPDGFSGAQYNFYARTHYQPVLAHAKDKGLNVDDRGVQEALFSISVQHGGAKSIVDKAMDAAKGKDPASQIKALYSARYDYVDKLKTLPKDTKASVLDRYDREVSDALALVGKSGVGTPGRPTEGREIKTADSGGAGVDPVSRATLPDIDSVAPRQDTSGVKVDADGKATISKDIGDTQSDIPGAPKDGEPTASSDDLVEHDQPEWAYMSPATRRKLINYARTSYRAVATQAVEDDIVRIKRGLPPVTKEDGKTSLDRARASMTNMQYQKVEQKWKSAQFEFESLNPVRMLTDSEADEYRLQLRSQAEAQGVPLQTLVAVEGKMKREIEKRSQLLAKDPYKYVLGDGVGSEDENRPPMDNTRAAWAKIKASRKANMVTGPDGTPQPAAVSIGPDGERIEKMTTVQERVLLAEAALADQQTIWPDEPDKWRIMSHSDAERLLELKKVDINDTNKYRRALEAAAQRAVKKFGPEMGRRALGDALKLVSTDKANERLRTRILESMAFNEPVVVDDLIQARRLDDLDRNSLSIGMGALINADRVGRVGGLPSPMPAIDSGRPAIATAAQEGGRSGRTLPNAAEIDWLRKDPAVRFKVFAAEFGEDAAGAALLGGPDPWGEKGQNRKDLPKKKESSEFERNGNKPEGLVQSVRRQLGL